MEDEDIFTTSEEGEPVDPGDAEDSPIVDDDQIADPTIDFTEIAPDGEVVLPRVFASQPVPPYNPGDMWEQNDETRICITAKDAEQAFSADDWELYTDAEILPPPAFITVTRANDEVIDDYSQEALDAYEAAGAVPIAILDDGTERVCQWSEVFDPRPPTIAEVVTMEADAIAKATNQHFWHRAKNTDGLGAGAFVTDSTQDEFIEASTQSWPATKSRTDTFTGDGTTTVFYLNNKANSTTYTVTVGGSAASPTKTNESFTFATAPADGAEIVASYMADTPWNNMLMNSLGILLRKGLTNIASFTHSAVAFFDSNGNEASNILASFGKDYARVGAGNSANVGIAKNAMSFSNDVGMQIFHVDTYGASENVTSRTNYPKLTVSGGTSDANRDFAVRTEQLSLPIITNGEVWLKLPVFTYKLTSLKSSQYGTLTNLQFTSVNNPTKEAPEVFGNTNVVINGDTLTVSFENDLIPISAIYGNAAFFARQGFFSTVITNYFALKGTDSGGVVRDCAGYFTQQWVCYDREGKSYVPGNNAVGLTVEAEFEQVLTFGRIGLDITIGEAYAEAQSTLNVPTMHYGTLNGGQGAYSVALGRDVSSVGDETFVVGNNTAAGYDNQTVIGKYNDNQSNTAFEIGNGTSDTARSNALTVDWNGNTEASGEITDGSGNVLSDKADTTDLADYLPLAGGTMTGNMTSKTINHQATNIDRDVAPSANTWGNAELKFLDKDGQRVGGINVQQQTNGQRTSLFAENASSAWNELKLIKRTDGTNVVEFTDVGAWKKALGHDFNWAIGTNNTTDTWVPVWSNGALEHRVIPTAYNSTPLALNAGGTGQTGTDTANVTLTDAKVYGTEALPTCYKWGKIVTVIGAVSPKSEVAANGTLTIGTIPSGYRPPRVMRTMCQGSSRNTWMLEVSTNGVITASRYRSETGYNAIGTSAWLPFYVTYVIS